MTNERSKFALGLEEGLREALAWKRGEIALETVIYKGPSIAAAKDDSRTKVGMEKGGSPKNRP